MQGPSPLPRADTAPGLGWALGPALVTPVLQLERDKLSPLDPQKAQSSQRWVQPDIIPTPCRSLNCSAPSFGGLLGQLVKSRIHNDICPQCGCPKKWGMKGLGRGGSGDRSETALPIRIFPGLSPEFRSMNPTKSFFHTHPFFFPLFLVLIFGAHLAMH